MRIKTMPVPPCGWNSYDCYGGAINEAQAMANLDVFLKKLKPHGFDYFCLDAGWYADGTQLLHNQLREVGQFRTMHIDEYGRYIPSNVNFPNWGLRALADRCHEAGIKFGVHVMRGMPLKALHLNTRIKGTDYRARDIYAPDDYCNWCGYWVATDVSKPGAQEYYDSVVEYLADELTVDFIKLDDVTEHVEHVESFAKAVEKCSRPILLSLSPGREMWEKTMRHYADFSNMVRITPDAWDDDATNAVKLDRWLMLENCELENRCWLDLDMIPFGGLQVDMPHCSDPAFNKELGFARQSNMTPEGKRTMMTILAMAASPLIFGGDLPTTPDEDFAYVLNPEVLRCNRNGVVGKRVNLWNHMDIRRTPDKHDPSRGWLGVFNVNQVMRHVRLSASALGFETMPRLHDVWNDCDVTIASDGMLELYVPAEGSCFFTYHA